MAAQNDTGARTLATELAASPSNQASSLASGAGGDVAKERAPSPQNDRSVMEKFLHHLRLALSAPPA